MGLYELGVTFPESSYHISPFPNDTPSFLYATVAEMGFRVKIGIPFLAIITSSSARAFSISLEK